MSFTLYKEQRDFTMQALYQKMAAMFCAYMVTVFGLNAIPTRSGWLKAKGLKSRLPATEVDHDAVVIELSEYTAFIAATIERVKAVIEAADRMSDGVMAAVEVRLNMQYDKPTEPVHKYFWEYAALFLVSLDSKNIAVIPGIGTIRYFKNEEYSDWVISNHKGCIHKVNGEIVRFDNPLNALNALLGCRRSVPAISQRPW